MSARPAFASGHKIGGLAKHSWICLVCDAQFTTKPAKHTQCRGSNVKAHPTQAQHFASQAEARRYMELRLLERAGKVSSIECQPKFELSVNGVRMGQYRADFVYRDNKYHGPGRNYEEIKGGAMTEISDWKRRHAEAQYGVKITIVQMKSDRRAK